MILFHFKAFLPFPKRKPNCCRSDCFSFKMDFRPQQNLQLFIACLCYFDLHSIQDVHMCVVILNKFIFISQVYLFIFFFWPLHCLNKIIMENKYCIDILTLTCLHSSKSYYRLWLLYCQEFGK